MQLQKQVDVWSTKTILATCVYNVIVPCSYKAKNSRVLRDEVIRELEKLYQWGLISKTPFVTNGIVSIKVDFSCSHSVFCILTIVHMN